MAARDYSQTRAQQPRQRPRDGINRKDGVLLTPHEQRRNTTVPDRLTKMLRLPRIEIASSANQAQSSLPARIGSEHLPKTVTLAESARQNGEESMRFAHIPTLNAGHGVHCPVARMDAVQYGQA